MGMNSMKQDRILIRNNIEKLVYSCSEHINRIKRFSREESISEDVLERTISELEALRDKWARCLERIDRYGMDDEGEYSYPALSYSGSYAFVILSGILKDFRFELERMQLLDAYYEDKTE